MAQTVVIQWVTRGNRRGLSKHQLMKHDHLRAFFERFKHCFELDEQADVYWFIEND